MLKYLYGLIVVLVVLLAIAIYCHAEDNVLTIKSGTIIFVTPDLKYRAISYTEPTGFYATEGCEWEDKNTEKVYIMENNVWVNKEKTPSIAIALDELTTTINDMQNSDEKIALEKIKETLHQKYKDKDEE